MSGHNKWSTIKHNEGDSDDKRGTLCSRRSTALPVDSRYAGRDTHGKPNNPTAQSTAKNAYSPK